jgi:hypothetical protein
MRLAFIEPQWKHNAILRISVGSCGNPKAIRRNQWVNIREWPCRLVKLKSVNMTLSMFGLFLEIKKADPSGQPFKNHHANRDSS